MAVISFASFTSFSSRPRYVSLSSETHGENRHDALAASGQERSERNAPSAAGHFFSYVSSSLLS